MSADVLERAQEELKAGRVWKARDRLEGALANDPANQDVLQLLAEICFRMGDLPAAGRYRFLTEAAGLNVREAEAALRERSPTRRALFAALPLKAPLDAYPRSVQVRVDALLGDDRDASWQWAKKLRGAGRKSGPSPRDVRPGSDFAVALIVGILVAPWIIGIVTIAVLTARAIGRLF